MKDQRKKYHYVLVFRGDGMPRFVTECSMFPKKICKWEADGKPLEFPDEVSARDTAFGLTLNGNYAVAVSSWYEIETHPYKEVEDA